PGGRKVLQRLYSRPQAGRACVALLRVARGARARRAQENSPRRTAVGGRWVGFGSPGTGRKRDRPHPYVIDQPLRTVGPRYLLASTLLVIFIFTGSYSSLPSTRRAITPSSIHSTNGAATLKLEQA